MISEIVLDFLEGIIKSIRVDRLIQTAYLDTKIANLIWKICKYNLLLHLLPLLLVEMVEYTTGVSLGFLLVLLYYPLTLFSNALHMLYYMDLINNVQHHARRYQVRTTSSNYTSPVNTISVAATMAIYKFTIYLTSQLITTVLNSKFPLLEYTLSFCILMIYHAICCYNNLWQFQRIKMEFHIDMYEKLWPYYLGYGLISSILYLQSDDWYMLIAYNVYTMLVVALPFLLETRYPEPGYQPYPPINLTPFAYFSRLIMYIVKPI